MNKQDYIRYRGKCKEYSEYLACHVPELRLVRGYYTCAITGVKEEHWWCETEEGEIIDPTKYQFPSCGIGEYEEFNGFFPCEQCGRTIREGEGINIDHYIVCSHKCALNLVGL